MSEQNDNDRDNDRDDNGRADNDRDNYLWDQSGPPDPEVQKLENLLSGFAHDDRRLRARDRQPAAWRRAAILVASVLLCVAGIFAWSYFGRSQPDASEVKLLVVDEGRVLHENEWFDATSESRELRLERSDTWLGEFNLEPGSRLQAREIRDELAQLYLQNGRMHAFVYLDAHPRFVQTATPATNCVDLGCKYTLTVDDAGDSVVVVTMGRVAFEDNGREVYVPHDATCRATKAHGAGTPRYLDAPPSLVQALDAFDAAHGKDAGERLQLCKNVLAAMPNEDRRHCLSVFHFLQDRHGAVAEAAREWLVAHVVPRTLRDDRAKMKDYLEANYWWK
ncbi:MAG: FecR family protein [Planctomycetota bacterium]|jgi:hypothetical protein